MTDTTSKLFDPELAAVAPRDPLMWLFSYRLTLALILTLVFSSPDTAPWLASSASNDPRHARLLLALQAQSVLMGGLFLILRWPSREQQIEIAVFLDIVLYTLLMHFSGGVNTGLGLILAMVVATGALTMQGRLSLLFAAFATLAVIAQQVYAQLYLTTPTGSSTQAGLLGMTYFAVALLAHVFMRRLRATESLATRRRRDLAGLAQLNEYIICNMTMGVLAVNGERTILLLNHAARRLLTLNGAATGQQLAQVAPALNQWLTQTLRPTVAVTHHTLAPDGGGGQTLQVTLHLLGDGRADGCLLFVRDQREVIRHAQELKLASLGRLTASIAHNIRNPLSAVTHASQLLAESPQLTADDLQLLAIMRRNALRIDETVTSVLELSRRQQPQPQLLALAAWLHEFCHEYQTCKPTHAGPCVQLQVAASAPDVTVAVDPRHLRQIVRNLCDNAFQHGQREGQPPQVTLVMTRPADSDTVQVTVCDTGPGVAPDNVPTLFDPFFTTSHTGTGLGLYAARELAQANALGLEYISASTAGAQFRLTFSITHEE